VIFYGIKIFFSLHITPTAWENYKQLMMNGSKAEISVEKRGIVDPLNIMLRFSGL
jgi:hypothetical protein